MFWSRVCDDEVLAQRLPGPGVAQAWREWEIELVGRRPASARSHRRATSRRGAPLRPPSPSKLDRILGDAVPPARRKPPPPRDWPCGSAGRWCRPSWPNWLGRPHKQDARLKAEQPGSIHKLRIAARRIRSGARGVQAPPSTGLCLGPLGEELRWLGQNPCREARDAQVLRERLLLPRGIRASRTGPWPRPESDRRRAEILPTDPGWSRRCCALDSERYFRLLDALDELLRVHAV